MGYANRLLSKEKKQPGSVDPEVLRILKKPVTPVWSQEENVRFLQAVKEHGNHLKKITEAMSDTKRYHQIKFHYNRVKRSKHPERVLGCSRADLVGLFKETPYRKS